MTSSSKSKKSDDCLTCPTDYEQRLENLLMAMDRAMKGSGNKPTKKDTQMQNKKSPDECMAQALDTLKEKRKEYGDSYLKYGQVMMALFPNGITVYDAEDFNRLGLLNMIVHKLVRYANQWENKHQDSIHDLGVYAFMLEALDTHDSV